MMWLSKKHTFFFILIIFDIVYPIYSQAQSLYGTTGLINVPTARMQQDGTFSLGFSYYDRKNQQYFEGTRDLGVGYINFTFLPYVELVMRVNKALYYSSDTYTFDRFPLIRIRILKERKYHPAIAVGTHDFGSTADWKTIHFNATYIVFSKKISEFDLHFGFAPRIMKALYYQLNGPFGGVGYSLFKRLNLYAEYDTRCLNVGFQYELLKHFNINLAAINGDSFAGGFNYKIFL